MFLILIQSTFNGGFWQSVTWLWLPLAILIFGFTWLNRHFFYAQTGSRRQPWFIAILLYPIVLLMTWPYVMALNAATASGDTTTFRGQVVRKWIHHSARYGDSCELDLRDSNSGETVTLTVPQSRYDSLSVGDVTMEKFLRGGLGIPFRWIFTKTDQTMQPTLLF